MNNIIKNRLIESYQLLFPESNVRLLLINDVNFTTQRPYEINTLASGDLVYLNSFFYEVVDIIVDKKVANFRTFVINVTETNISTTVQHGVKLGRKELAKKILLKKFPFIFERLKYYYLNKKENKINLEHNKLPLIRENNIVRNTSKKALVCLHWLDLGGAEVFAVECIQHLKKIGYEVIVVCAHKSRDFYSSKFSEDIKIYQIDSFIPQGKEVEFIYNLCKQEDISLIHNHHNIYLYESLPLLRLNNLNIFIIDSLHIIEKKRFHEGFPRISLVWTNYIDIHHVISTKLKNYLLDYGVESSKIKMGHLGKDLSIQKSFSIIDSLKSKKLNICFIGRMSGQKRPLIAMKLLMWTVNYLKKRNIQSSIHIVGDGEYFDSFKYHVINKGLDKEFIFYGSSANAEKILELSDLSLLTSENEGITLVAYEAYRNGCLMVSTDVGAQSELIPQNLLLSENPIDAFATWKITINKIITEPSFVEASINEFKTKAKAIYNLDTAERLFNKLYQGEIK